MSKVKAAPVKTANAVKAPAAPTLGAGLAAAAAASAALKPAPRAPVAVTASLVWGPKAPAAKRGKAQDRYVNYKGATTVADYLAKGGTRADLNWDSAPGREYFTIV